MKVEVFIYMKNLGDGSCCVRFFNSKSHAEQYAEKDDERFCDDIYSKTLEFDDNGKFINEDKIFVYHENRHMTVPYKD